MLSDTTVSATFTLVTPPVLALFPNATTFPAGSLASFTLAFANPGPAGVGDFYLGAVLPAGAGPAFGCPGGDAMVFFANAFTSLVTTCFSAAPTTFAPLLTNVAVPAGLGLVTVPDLLRFTWPAGAPFGSYLFFGALTSASAFNGATLNLTDVVGLAVVTVEVGP
jgi:hypothetical protein